MQNAAPPETPNAETQKGREAVVGLWSLVFGQQMKAALGRTATSRKTPNTETQKGREAAVRKHGGSRRLSVVGLWPANTSK
jgi:hypothetical protein